MEHSRFALRIRDMLDRIAFRRQVLGRSGASPFTSLYDTRSSDTCAAEAPPCPRPGRLTVLHRRRAIHEDPIDSLRVVVRIIFERIRMGPSVRGAILHPRQVEDDEVGGASLSDEPAVLEAQ